MLYSKEGNVEGEIRWLGLKKMLKLDKHKEHHWVFQFQLDIVTIEMVINFITIDSFEGFMDTQSDISDSPGGRWLRLEGKYKQNVRTGV